jgi:hypothetical protein
MDLDKIEECFKTTGGNQYHIIKEIIQNPPFPYNSKSEKVQAYCHIHCESSNAVEYLHFYINHESDKKYLCPKCLERYKKNNV